MAILDFSSYDPTHLDSGNRCNKPGKAVLLLTSATEQAGDNGPYYKSLFDVVAHEDSSQVGTEYCQFFSLTGKGSKGLMKVARALGILTDEIIQNAILSNKKTLNIDLASGEGNLVAGELKTRKKDDNLIIWDFYALDDPTVAGFPKPENIMTLEKKPEPAVEKGPGTAATDDGIPF